MIEGAGLALEYALPKCRSWETAQRTSPRTRECRLMADTVLWCAQVKPLELTGGVILASLGSVLMWDGL